MRSIARGALIEAGSTVSVAAFARSALPASSCNQTRTTCVPAGTATEFTRAIALPVTTLSAQAAPSASQTS